MATSKTKRQGHDQVGAFRKAARAAGCDDNEERFRDALRTVARAKPSGGKGQKIRSESQRKHDRSG